MVAISSKERQSYDTYYDRFHIKRKDSLVPIKITYTNQSPYGISDTFPASNYYMKDGWVHITGPADQLIASVRETEVLRIDNTDY